MNNVNKTINKINLLKNDSVYAGLSPEIKDSLAVLGSKYRLSYQELRQLTEMSADFSMWQEISVYEYANEIESRSDSGTDKKEILRAVKDRWNTLKNSKIKYQARDNKISERPKPRKVTLSTEKNKVFGMCPVASEKIAA